jgi:serpin B
MIFMALLAMLCAIMVPSTSHATTASPEQVVADASNAFGFKLYGKIAAEHPATNQFMSPISVFAALAMTSEGTANESLKILSKTLGLPETAVLHAGITALARMLNRADAPYALALANAIWPDKSCHLQPTFQATIQKVYGGASMPQDFTQNAETARKTINAWVAQKTNDRIQDLLPLGSIDAMTRMVLTNAIYFKGKWKNEFDKALTSDQPFTVADGKKVMVPLMHMPAAQSACRYAELDGMQVLQLPYQGDELSMVVLLPQLGGMEKLEAGLDAGKWATIGQSLYHAQVNVWLPRFKMKVGGSIKQPLGDMGMAPLFQGADFSRMFLEDMPLAISDVIHKAFVEVNEEGTEAAAATAVIVTETDAMEPITVDFRADHPFLFMIQHNATKSVLFMGKVMNPVAG